MPLNPRLVARLGLFLGLCLATAACAREYPLIAAQECSEIVAHSKKLLGAGVKDKSDDELLGICRASTARQRGCVKLATVAADVMKCSLVRD